MNPKNKFLPTGGTFHNLTKGRKGPLPNQTDVAAFGASIWTSQHTDNSRLGDAILSKNEVGLFSKGSLEDMR